LSRLADEGNAEALLFLAPGLADEGYAIEHGMVVSRWE
jgi:phage tail protein X